MKVNPNETKEFLKLDTKRYHRDIHILGFGPKEKKKLIELLDYLKNNEKFSGIYSFASDLSKVPVGKLLNLTRIMENVEFLSTSSVQTAEVTGCPEWISLFK